MSTLTLVNGQVKYAAKRFNTKNGERLNAVIALDGTDEEVTLWGNPDDEDLLALKREQLVQLSRDDKGRYKLAIAADGSAPSNGNGSAPPRQKSKPPGANAASNNGISWQEWTDDEKEALLEKARYHSWLARHCYQQVQDEFAATDTEASEETIRQLAIAIYENIAASI